MDDEVAKSAKIVEQWGVCPNVCVPTLFYNVRGRDVGCGYLGIPGVMHIETGEHGPVHIIHSHTHKGTAAATTYRA